MVRSTLLWHPIQLPRRGKSGGVTGIYGWRAFNHNFIGHKLYEMEMLKRNAEKQAMEDSKADIGWGSQIRSYVLDDSRIKDLRTGVETRNTQSVLDGALDPFIQASLKQGL